MYSLECNSSVRLGLLVQTRKECRKHTCTCKHTILWLNCWSKIKERLASRCFELATAWCSPGPTRWGVRTPFLASKCDFFAYFVIFHAALEKVNWFENSCFFVAITLFSQTNDWREKFPIRNFWKQLETVGTATYAPTSESWRCAQLCMNWCVLAQMTRTSLQHCKSSYHIRLLESNLTDSNWIMRLLRW